MEMGFDEKEVMDALRVNNNQQNAAVSNTAGRRRRVPWALRQAGRQVGGGAELSGPGRFSLCPQKPSAVLGLRDGLVDFVPLAPGWTRAQRSGELPGRGWGGSFAHLRGQSRAVAKQLGDREAWTWGTPSPARPLPRSRAQRS